MKSGLVSISFRSLSVEELLKLVQSTGQQGIEWGGDVHVPHGDTSRAEEVARWTEEAGLEVAAYGSYYRLAETENVPEFSAVLDSALALKAPSIRVWAGRRASLDADEAYRKAVEEDTRRICALAAKEDMRISFEYHGGTLTDSIPSAVELLGKLQLPNLDSLWQPPNGQPEEVCEESLESILPRVSNIHVFHWGNQGWNERYPLKDGRKRWTRYLEILHQHTRPDRWALLEFAMDDSPRQYKEDAGVLQELLKPYQG